MYVGVFFPSVLRCCFVYLFLSDADSMRFVSFLLLHVKRLQLKIDL